MKNIVLLIACVATLVVAAQGAPEGISQSPPPYKVSEMLERLGLRQVQVGGELGRRIELTVKGNLLRLDLDKVFLAALNGGNYTGFYDPTCGPYLGLGTTSEAMAWLGANTGNEALIALKNRVFEAIVKSQASDGYIGLLPPERRTTWTLLGDYEEEAEILEALVANYQLFGSQESLSAARKLADYLINKRWPQKPVDWEKIIPVHEISFDGGWACSLLYLYEITGDQRYLGFATNELGTEKLNLPIVLGRYLPIEGHAGGYLSNCQVRLELYRLRGEPELLKPSNRAAEFMTREDGMMITGAIGKDECWTNDQDGSKNLGETCATAYQIFVFDRLLRLEGDSRWGDLIERSLYNTAFGAQSPDGRRLRYFTSLEGKIGAIGRSTAIVALATFGGLWDSFPS